MHRIMYQAMHRAMRIVGSMIIASAAMFFPSARGAPSAPPRLRVVRTRAKMTLARFDVGPCISNEKHCFVYCVCGKHGLQA